MIKTKQNETWIDGVEKAGDVNRRPKKERDQLRPKS
jgi:hypothetical protein